MTSTKDGRLEAEIKGATSVTLPPWSASSPVRDCANEKITFTLHRTTQMNVVTIGVHSLAATKARFSDAIRGRKQRPVARIDFASSEFIWRILAPNRLQILRAMCGAGPLAPREIACRIGRNVKGVHTDIHALRLAGMLDRVEEGLVFPFDAIHVDFPLTVAA